MDDSKPNIEQEPEEKPTVAEKPQDKAEGKTADAKPTVAESAKAPAELEEPHRLIAACAYLGLLLAIPLLMDRDDEFVRFHVRQGLALFALQVVASFGFLSEAAGTFVLLLLVAASIVAAWRTYHGRKWLLPVLGRYAQKIQL